MAVASCLKAAPGATVSRVKSYTAETDIVAHELNTSMNGAALTPADDDYDAARGVWNAAVQRRPALLAVCSDAADVQAAVQTARAHELPLSVRGGGHDWCGRALRDGGIVVDLSGMRQVTVDTGRGIASAGGGATSGDVVEAAEPHGLVAATGVVGKVGMAGLTLAGGYGPLDGRYGLALDNLVSADVVLADGREVAAGEAQDAELLWALRGSGGAFGVVTNARYRLHRLAGVLAGMVLYSLADAPTVLRRCLRVAADAPDELSLMWGFLGMPKGPALFLLPVWSGEPATGEPLMAEMQELGRPLSAGIDFVPYADVLGFFDEQVVDGRHYWIETRWLPAMTDAAVDALLSAAAGMTSPFSLLNVKPFHGAAARVPEDATAFALRRNHFLIEVVAAWDAAGETPDGSARHVDWARWADAKLAPMALPGGYPNLLSAGAGDRARLAYGGNAARLLDLKRRYDPDVIFRSAPGIAP
jgi:FAD/FMN-containing dehydrogenase